MRRMSAADVRLQRLEFHDHSSLSSLELSPRPSPQCTPVLSSTDICLPPADNPLTPQGKQLASTSLLRVPKLFFTKGSSTCSVNRSAAAYCPIVGNESISDNEQGCPHSILSPHYQTQLSLSKSISTISLDSSQSKTPQPNHQRLDVSQQNSNFFSSSNGVGGMFRGLLRRSGLRQEDHTHNNDVVSETSGEEVVNPGPCKSDSMAGSVYDLADGEDGSGLMDSGGGCGNYKMSKSGLRWWLKRLECKVQRMCTFRFRIDPHGTLFFVWLGVVAIAVTYNALAIPLRASYGEIVEGDHVIIMWLIFDYLFDLIFLMDLLLVQPLTCKATTERYKIDVSRAYLIRRHVSMVTFWTGLLSLLPLDILYAVPALRFNVLLRLPRVLKVRSIKQFQDRFESRTRYPNVFRVAKLVSYFLYIIHVYSCIYYSVSEREGFGVNRWVYNGNGTSYLRCFYWAVQTVATAHNLDRGEPVTNLEYKIDLLGYIFSVFVLAVIFGEIRNIVEASNGQKMAAHRKWDRVRKYMNDWKLSKELQGRVKAWYAYALSQQLNIDEGKVLDSLPRKTKADLAIHVHLDTLSKVSLFKDCEKTLLRELVLKLQPVLFVPSDFICKKGEIGKEMYIVNKGLVQVIGGPSDNSRVLAELGPGSVFGEISLLAVGGGNRRTAHVISKGFSSIFVLSKNDLNETLQEYPDARETLRKKARLLLRQDRRREKKEGKTEGESLAERVRLASKIKNNHAAKVAFMAFSTAPAKAARAQAAALKVDKEEEVDNGMSPCRRSHSASTRSTIVEVHNEEEGGASPKTKTSCDNGSGQKVERAKVDKPAFTVPRRLTYTSLWPSAKDVVITTELVPPPGADPNHTSSTSL